jgi:hypothetical protein
MQTKAGLWPQHHTRQLAASCCCHLHLLCGNAYEFHAMLIFADILSLWLVSICNMFVTSITTPAGMTGWSCGTG